MTSPPIGPQSRHLGAFELHDELGKGGMGVIYRALHRDTGLPVAIKIMTAPVAQQPLYREAFRREVRAMARLNHPGIAMVLDVGEADAATADRLGLPGEGARPYLAMELVEGTPLTPARFPPQWTYFRTLALALFDALGHAHAQSVVHRDLKPGNILIPRTPDAPLIKLVDFGIARALDTAGESLPNAIDTSTLGTPSYMAPEQILGSWRDQGPWTDLYAVGCLLWQLLTGESPFRRDSNQTTLRAHLEDELPAFEPRCPVPDGADEWLDRLLARAPRQRFQRAADAAFALSRLGEVDAAPGHAPAAAPPASQGDDMTTIVERGAHTLLSLPETIVGDLGEATSAQTRPHVSSARASSDLHAAAEREIFETMPPVPPDWRRGRRARRSVQMVGAGLGLFGLRTIPMVDRLEARDRLWETLQTTAETRGLRAVLIEGASGQGKSRLAEWLARRAHEVGGATILKAMHSRVSGPLDGLGPMLARHFYTLGLDRPKLVERLRNKYAELGLTDVDALHDTTALTDIIVESTQGGVSRRTYSPKERYRIYWRLLRALGRERPVILWLDDIQWGRDAINFARFLLDQPDDIPVLLTLTARTEALAEQAGIAEHLESVAADARTLSLTLSPFAEDDQHELVSQLLHLSPEVTRTVVERTEGNPLFAVQLVGSWVERDILEIGPQGLQLAGGVEADLPDDVHELWLERLDSLARGLDSLAHTEMLVSLELAAALGQEVGRQEWRAVCRAAGVSASARLLEAMYRRGLAVAADNGWSFAHSMLRDSLERHARERGRLASHHGLCAEVIADLYDSDSPEVAARRAEHLIEAGRRSEALDALLLAAAGARDNSEFDWLDYLIRRAQGVLDALELHEDDLRWSRFWQLRALQLGLEGHLDEAHALLDKAEALARRLGSTEELALVTTRRGKLWRHTGDFDRAEQLYRDALASFRQLGAEDRIARTSVKLGNMELLRGRPAKARELLEPAADYFRTQPTTPELAEALGELSFVYALLEDSERATSALDEAFAVLDRAPNRAVASGCWNMRGEVERRRGDFEAARHAYARSYELSRSLRGDYQVLVPKLNMYLCQLATGNFDGARAFFQEALDEWSGRGSAYLLPYPHLGIAWCAAHEHDWAAWDHHLQGALDIVDTDIAAEADLAWMAENAGRLALEADQPERARAALEFAHGQWAALDEEAKADRVAQLLSGI